MASLTSVVFLTWLWSLVLTFEDQKNITAGHGDLVTLPCQDPRHTNITSVEWIRPDLEPKYVFGVYRLWWFKKEEQNPSFKNRAKLKDGEMRDGDASVVLKDVGTEDTGTYMCHVRQRGAQSTMSIVHLTVDPGELPLLHPSVQMRTENITAEPGEKLDVVVAPDPDPPLSMWLIFCHVVMCTPYFIFTLLMISTHRHK